MVHIITFLCLLFVEFLKSLKTPTTHRNIRSVENIAALRAGVGEVPYLSIPHRAQELGLKKQRIGIFCRKDLSLYSYRIVLTQELKQLFHRQRLNLKVIIIFQKIIFSDETHS